MAQYKSTHTGAQIDSGIDNALALRQDVSQHFAGNMARNQVFKVGTFLRGSGAGNSGCVRIKVVNASANGQANALDVYVDSNSFSYEWHGNINTAYYPTVYLYRDSGTEVATTKYYIYVKTVNYADHTAVYYDNAKNFTVDWQNVTSTFDADVASLTLKDQTYYEWLNPPMALGVEYRTTERYLGKAVYVAVWNAGSCTNGTTVYWGTGITGFISAVIKTGTDAGQLPILNGTSIGNWSYFADVGIDRANGRLSLTWHTGSSASGSFGNNNVIVKYTKD